MTNSTFIMLLVTLCTLIALAHAAMNYGGRHSIKELYTIVADGYGDFVAKSRNSELLQSRALASFVNKDDSTDVTRHYENFLIDKNTNTFYLVSNGYNVLRKFEPAEYDSFNSQVSYPVSNISEVAFRFHWRPYYWRYSMNYLNNLVTYREEIGVWLHGKAKNSYFQVVNHPDGMSVMVQRYGTNQCLQIESVTRVVVPPLAGFQRTCDTSNTGQMFKWDGIHLIQKRGDEIYYVCFSLDQDKSKYFTGKTGGRSNRGTIVLRDVDRLYSSTCEMWMREAGYNRDTSVTPNTFDAVEAWYAQRTLVTDDSVLTESLNAADYRFAWAGASTTSISTLTILCVAAIVTFLL